MGKVKSFFVGAVVAVVAAAAWILVVVIRHRDNKAVAEGLVEQNQQAMDEHREATADRIAEKTHELEAAQINEIVARFKEKFQ